MSSRAYDENFANRLTDISVALRNSHDEEEQLGTCSGSRSLAMECATVIRLARSRVRS